MAEITPPLNKLQLEVLKLISKGISDDELLDIKKMIVDYFAKKASNEADKVWISKGWNDAKVDEILNDPNQ